MIVTLYSLFLFVFLFFFFFQAEDGIRDVAVTGVQTCALPISTRTRTWHACSRASSEPRSTDEGPRRDDRHSHGWRSRLAAVSGAGVGVRGREVGGPGGRPPGGPVLRLRGAHQPGRGARSEEHTSE